MINNLKNIIENEDSRNPHTDIELAELLNTFRENITKLRIEASIPDSRTRRKKLIEYEIVNILTKQPKISERKLTEKLNAYGFIIARSSVNKYRKDVQEKLFVPEVLKPKEEVDPFEDLIGSNDSLKTQINQAKASILYPPMGLHTLIVGPSGSGKSFVAQKMYEYSKTTKNFKENVRFEIFNCADYAENPQLLLSQLFGYVKGAFTGATEDKKGLVELCDGGILFLDEIHRLPPEGQEILFYLLDQNLYRRLGETELTRKSKLLLIGATTEDPSKTLLLTFRRRIPINIEMPSYHERTTNEKYNFIKMFFENESKRVNKPFKIKRDVIKSLLSYSCKGNIGQLKSDIQATSAKGFLHATINQKSKIIINFQDLPKQIIGEIINKNNFDEEVYLFSHTDLIINESDSKENENKEMRAVSVLMQTETIYDFIENTYKTMKLENYTEDNIKSILSERIDGEMQRLSKISYKKEMSYEILKNIIGTEALEATKKSFQIADKYLSNLDSKLIFPLAIHLNSAINRFFSNKVTINPNLNNIKQEYKEEYKAATFIKEFIDGEYDINLPQDEVGFIAMYLKNFKEDMQIKTTKIGVVVLSHGNVAKGMADVANKLLGVDHALGLEMDLTDSPNLMLEKTIPLVKNADQGKGVLILADMGSLILFGDIISARTGILVRVVGRVDTLMVIESVRRALLPEDTLDNLADEIDSKKFLTGSTFVSPIKRKKVIVTLCLTGEGAAKVLKNYIETSIMDFDEDIEIVPMGFFSTEDTSTALDKIGHSNEIVAIVGTINPNYNNVSFVSAEDLLSKSNKLLHILNSKGKIYRENTLKNYIDLELIHIENNFVTKNDVLDRMTKKLIKQQKVTGEYILSVYKRETMGNTFLEGGIAIPHGESKYITQPAISITKLATPILWENNQYVSLIFLLALTEHNGKEIEDLYKLLYKDNISQLLLESTSNEEIHSILTKITL
ncbi:sigma 54 modulation protein [Carnobacterium alterfunditum]|uniref:Sigma 54 modulation protein n=1 Tax=Carnobacterium alterfunditum TaxID=28230 RepID=A0A1N6ERY1_9LACT|nr:sigma 54-interacting transcriptional regulator [Carnobacterium alterfunditum]SIN85786.1 sigma 54 modulation protein [Carnobacterium alterfunditum]